MSWALLRVVALGNPVVPEVQRIPIICSAPRTSRTGLQRRLVKSRYEFFTYLPIIVFCALWTREKFFYLHCILHMIIECDDQRMPICSSPLDQRIIATIAKYDFRFCYCIYRIDGPRFQLSSDCVKGSRVEEASKDYLTLIGIIACQNANNIVGCESLPLQEQCQAYGSCEYLRVGENIAIGMGYLSAKSIIPYTQYFLEFSKLDYLKWFRCVLLECVKHHVSYAYLGIKVQLIFSSTP